MVEKSFQSLNYLISIVQVEVRVESEITVQGQDIAIEVQKALNTGIVMVVSKTLVRDIEKVMKEDTVVEGGNQVATVIEMAMKLIVAVEKTQGIEKVARLIIETGEILFIEVESHRYQEKLTLEAVAVVVLVVLNMQQI